MRRGHGMDSLGRAARSSRKFEQFGRSGVGWWVVGGKKRGEEG